MRRVLLGAAWVAPLLLAAEVGFLVAEKKGHERAERLQQEELAAQERQTDAFIKELRERVPAGSELGDYPPEPPFGLQNGREQPRRIPRDGVNHRWFDGFFGPTH